MRIVAKSFICTLALAHFALGAGQTWEKRVAPGLVYREDVDLSIPLVIHAVRFSIGSPDVRAEAQLAELSVFDDNLSKGRETVSELVARTNAIGGINGDFFPFTGKPLGAMVRSGELVSVPSIPRSVFGWGAHDSQFAIPKYQGSIEVSGNGPIRIDNLNAECGLNEVVLDTETANLALGKVPNIGIVLNIGAGQWTTDSNLTADVTELVPDLHDRKIGKHEAIVVATGAKMASLGPIHKGDRLTIRLTLTGFDWAKINQAVGGGPFLVRDGKVAVDWEAEGFKTAFADNRHPRTMIGRTSAGDLWMVVIDGRSPQSAGATLDEGARVMLRLGCVDAMNLDGGGSSTLNLLGLCLNKPSDGEERKVAQAVLFVGTSGSPRSVSLGGPCTIQAPLSVGADQTAQATVVDANGKPVPNAEVLWSATGPGWIDQGGTFRPLHAGKATIVAAVRGRTVQAAIGVLAGPTGEEMPKKPVRSRPRKIRS